MTPLSNFLFRIFLVCVLASTLSPSSPKQEPLVVGYRIRFGFHRVSTAGDRIRRRLPIAAAEREDRG